MVAETKEITPLRDDYEDQEVRDCVRFLANAQGLHTRLDAADVMCARYYRGQQWAVRGQDEPYLPQTLRSGDLTTVANLIAPKVTQWYGRLMVTDWGAKFMPTLHETSDTDLDVQMVMRQKQAWWNKWYPFAGLTTWNARGSFRRLVLPSGGWGTYTFDPEAPGGVRVRLCSRPTLSPEEDDPEIENHEEYVDSRVMRWETFKRTEWYAAIKKKIGRDFINNARISDLRTKESYLGRALFQLQPGAMQDEALGVIIHLFFRERSKRRIVIVELSAPMDTEGKSYLGPSWFKLESKSWIYGCPYVKWDCLPAIGTAYQGGLVPLGIPQQDLVNLLVRGKAWDALYVVGKILAKQNNVLNPEVLESNKRFGTVWVKDMGSAPQIMQANTRDSQSDALISASLGWMQETMSVQDPMMGIGVASGRRPAAETQQLIQQGSTPIEAVAQLDFERMSGFFNRLSTATLLKYGRTDPKRFYFFVGSKNAKLRTLDVAIKTLEKNPGVCQLHRGAFLARSPQEIITELDLQLRANAITKWQYDWEKFLQTGYPGVAGQEAAMHSAEVLIWEFLNDKRDPSDIRSTDNHVLLIYLMSRIFEQRGIESYDDQQLDRLEEASLWCKRWLFENGMMEEASSALGMKFGKVPQTLSQPQPNAGPVGETGAAIQGQPAAVMPPNGGGVAVAAG